MQDKKLVSELTIKRKEAGLTQKQLAQLCGVSEISVRQWESQKSIPRADRAAKIFVLLGVSLASWADPGELADLSLHRASLIKGTVQ